MGIPLIFLLSIGTCLFFYLSYLIYKRSREIRYLFGFAALFIWTIAGGWIITLDRLTGMKGANVGLHYYYLFDKLFPVYLDSSYFTAILYYFLFLIVIQLTVLAFYYRRVPVLSYQIRPIVTNHWKFQLLSIVTALLSFLTISSTFTDAFLNDKSLYSTIHSTETTIFPVHQLLNQFSLLSLIIGFIILLSGDKGIFFKAKSGKFTMFLYIVLIILLEIYLAILGNKHEMFFGIIFGLLFYFDNMRKKYSLSHILLFIIIIGTPLSLTDFIRGNPLKNFLSDIKDFKVVLPTSQPYFDKQTTQNRVPKKTADMNPATDPQGPYLIRKAGSVLFSNEIFCAHLSMYGALINKVPCTYGTSFIFLAESFIPRAISNERHPDIYQYYAEKVNAEPGQGYTINSATGWYLNFGILGIIIGAIIIGILWGYGSIIRTFEANFRFVFLRILCFIFPIGFTAYIPVLIRTGPECFKSLLVEGILIPALVMLIGSLSFRKRNG